ncbi:FkbM family methyltransferase [Jiella avicenniae]|uniref:FkbM family methyltransferase n=1 Tax=Jiella avicenniae TaxID=2907202 RepID=A0A9X1P7Q1_9HYPH|nr:FkbM family methyltransferase [Jiella avicenniae]MCE7030813.1 FkbM family methyltransferase [Jiella avicenniae]
MDAASPGLSAARTFHALPDPATALALLGEANRRAPAGRPVAIGERDLWLYGAGNLGRLARAHCDVVGQLVAGVVDRNAEAHRDLPDWAGVSLRPPDEVSPGTKTRALLAVSIVTSPFVPLRDQLLADGWADVVPFYDVAEGFRHLHPLSNGWFSSPLEDAALTEAGEVLAGFTDDRSRAHYLRFAAWRLAREEWDFPQAPVTIGDRFFIPEVLGALRPAERVLDGGAHHGELVPRFFEAFGGTLERLWAIEPDPGSLRVLDAAGETWPADMRRRVAILDEVLAARCGPIRFHHGLGYASQIAPTGDLARRATTIDTLGLDSTVIKLHLEGGELDALKGARETIRSHRPILLATIYHDAAGLIETPLHLMRTLEDYAVFMRTHGYCGTGAVLYAIPKERLPS